MKTPDSSAVNSVYEAEAERAFTKQSSLFDSLYSSNAIVQYKRERVRRIAEKYLRPRSKILELNAGTGEDALYFAGKGHQVHATDISKGMLSVLNGKAEACNLAYRISSEVCSYTSLDKLSDRGPYDLIFSNFAGLNCTGELNRVLNFFSALLKPGGVIVVVILPEFCLWETLLLFKGKFKTAFRRFFAAGGAKAHIEGEYFKCWYYNPSYISKRLRNSFDLLDLEGLCTIVPPSYMEHFPANNPRLYELLKKTEEKLRKKWPWRSIGDYYILSMQKRAV